MSTVTKVTVQDTFSVVVQEVVNSVSLEQLEENVVPVVLSQLEVSRVVPTQDEIVVTIAAAQGPSSKYAEYSTTFVYEDGVLASLSNVGGTKTFIYEDGILAAIEGTGRYPDKTFTYTDGLLTFVGVS